MKKNKFKQSRNKVDRKFNRAFKEFDLSKEIINLIDIIDRHNILVSLFKILIGKSGKKFRNYFSYVFLMKLYTAEMYLDIYNFENKDKIISEINHTVNDLKNDLNLINENKNYELEYVSKYGITDENIKMNFNKYYSQVASIFSTVFFNDSLYENYYEFSYLLLMYINLDLYFNKYNLPNNHRVFSLKLDIQLKMIKTLAEIIPDDFNSLIMELNKWLEKFELLWFKDNRIIKKENK